jgi:hypothetical protein
MAVLGSHFCFYAERAEEISFLKAQNSYMLGSRGFFFTFFYSFNSEWKK